MEIEMENKEENIIAFVDTENVSTQIIDTLIVHVKYKRKNAKYVGTWCYGLTDQKSCQSVSWKKQVSDLKSFKWKDVNVKRKKNAVDEAIINDINKLIGDPKNDRLNHYIIVAADGDYCSIIKN